jgi:cysteine desulfurase
MQNFGNPSSLHKLGLTASQTVSAARKHIASSLGVSAEEIYFTSGATEADNTAIFGAANTVGKRKKRIVTTTVEHPAVAEPCRCLENNGFEIVRVSPRTDGFHAEDIVAAADENTCLVTCMLCNNETGAILPVGEAFRRIKKKFPQILTHCDMVQGYMKLPVKAKNLYADMISVSGHKVHAPKGIGALYVKKGVHIAPMMYGGGQERSFRSGTESVPLIAAFGAAVEELYKNMDSRFAHVKSLSDSLHEKISQQKGMHFNSPDNGSPYVNSISVDNLRSEVLLHFLESKDIYVSSGSACSKGKKSSVLSEFHIPDKLADSTLRISFCAENTASEIDLLIEALKEAQNTLLGVK